MKTQRNTTIEQVMTRDPVTCRPGDSMSCAATLMWEHDCGCLPVVDDGGHVVGMITDRDVCMAACFQGKPLSELRVESAMANQVITCLVGDTPQDAERLMQQAQVRRLPVLGLDNLLVGVVSLNDLARAAGGHNGITPESIEATLAAVGQSRAHALARSPS